MAKGGKGAKAAKLLAAQALSREELDTALGNWGGLAGAVNAGPFSRSVTVTNRLGKRVTVTAELRIAPAASTEERPYVLFHHPDIDPNALRGLVNDDPLAAGRHELVEWIANPNLRAGTAFIADRAKLTEQDFHRLTIGALE
jgi:hypothetical protein